MQDSTATGFHLIYGTGPAACWTARHLRARGLAVKAVHRSGQRPALMPADVAILQADLSQAQQAIDVTRGASVVYQALGPAYSQWAERFPELQANTVEAAMRAQARYVALENLYMVDAGQTIAESSPDGPRSVKGEVRLRMHRDLMDRHRAGDLQVSVLRASDYYGPGVTVSAAGERLFGPLVKARAAQVMGREDCLHSFAYIGDVGAALAGLGTAPRDQATWGQVWLAPHAAPQTQRAWVADACRLLGMPTRLTVVAPWMLRLVGCFNADARASVEMLYQYEQPFVVDARRSENMLGLRPTPAEEGLRATLDWYRGRSAAS
jgi:nucleoside-diphosphate-sugar epimerase